MRPSAALAALGRSAVRPRGGSQRAQLGRRNYGQSWDESGLGGGRPSSEQGEELEAARD